MQFDLPKFIQSANSKAIVTIGSFILIHLILETHLFLSKVRFSKHCTCNWVRKIFAKRSSAPEKLITENFYLVADRLHRPHAVRLSTAAPSTARGHNIFHFRYPPIWPLECAALHHYAQISVLSLMLSFFSPSIPVSTINTLVCDRNPINNLCVVARYEFSLFAAAEPICHTGCQDHTGLDWRWVPGRANLQNTTHIDWAANFSHSRTV